MSSCNKYGGNEHSGNKTKVKRGGNYYARVKKTKTKGDGKFSWVTVFKLYERGLDVRECIEPFVNVGLTSTNFYKELMKNPKVVMRRDVNMFRHIERNRNEINDYDTIVEEVEKTVQNNTYNLTDEIKKGLMLAVKKVNANIRQARTNVDNIDQPLNLLNLIQEIAIRNAGMGTDESAKDDGNVKVLNGLEAFYKAREKNQTLLAEVVE